MSGPAFAGGARGAWQVTSIDAVRGPSLPAVARLAPHPGTEVCGDAAWVLRGVPSHARYTRRSEREALVAREAGLGRPGATRAALIPLTKSPAWWELAQDERREVLEERSHHIATGLQHLPAVARQLYHGRDLGEPFDFLTWFEYAPQDASAFEELVAALRATPEWTYVEREVDIRLAR